MGMCSTYQKQDIVVNDREAVKELRKKHSDWGKPIMSNGEIDFYEWEDWKIQGYWYKECAEFLQDLAKHVVGYAEFTYEDGNAPFRIVFEAGEAFLQYPNISWETSKKSIDKIKE